MNKYIIAIAALLIFQGCDDGKDYLKHKISYERLGNCRDINTNVSVVSNTIGERFVFQECLDDEFKGDYSVSRKGDTIVVKLDKSSKANALFEVTLDINTRPAYTHLQVNDVTMMVTVKR